jgi:type I restriction enzyme, S subunit
MEKYKLEDICDEIKPGFPSGNHNSTGEGVLHFRPYNIDSSGRVDLSQNKFVPLKSAVYFLRQGDIVFNNTNSPELLGKTCYIQNPTDWVYSNHMTRIRVKENVHAQYCAIYLHFLFYSGFYRANCSNHVNQASISSSFLSKFVEVPLPTYAEQQQIVSKIEELFSELDKGIEELKTAQQQLKVYRQAVLKWAFEGKLTNENVKDGELPEGWKVETLGRIAKLINGDRGKNYPHRSEYVEKGIAFINTGHIEPNGKLSLGTMHYLKREKFDSLNSGKIIKGDLVYCLRGATLGKTAIVNQFEEGAIASSLVIIRLNKEISNRFIYYFLTGPLGRDCIFQFDNGSAQPNLSAKSVTLYKIPLPSFNEQLKVVQEIESRLSVCDKIEETITDTLKQAEALRQSILKKAFEGKLI